MRLRSLTFWSMHIFVFIAWCLQTKPTHAYTHAHSVGWDSRIHRLHICWGLRSSRPTSALDVTLSHLIAWLQFWECGVPLYCHCSQIPLIYIYIYIYIYIRGAYDKFLMGQFLWFQVQMNSYSRNWNTHYWLSLLVNFKNASWHFRRTICNKVVF